MTPRPRFSGLLRAELRKLLHQRANRVLLAGAVVVAGLLLASVASSPDATTALAPSADGFLKNIILLQVLILNTVTGVVLLVAGARLTGMEYSGGTIRVVLARGVGRLQFLGAKLTALAVLALVLLAVLTPASALQVLALARAWNVGWPGAAAWAALGPALGAVLISMSACVVLAVTAAVLGRSVAFASGAAMAFFPADNAIDLVGQLLHSDLLDRLSQYLLGPNLSTMPGVLVGRGPFAGTIAGEPLPVDGAHVLVVVGFWCLGLLTVAAALTWRRDVQE